MEKQSPSFLKRWQKRYFVLSKKMLRYYKSEADYNAGKPPKGVLNFQQIWIEPEFQDLQHKINLKIMGSERIFNLKCSSQDNYMIWQKRLRHSIKSSLGKIKEIRLDKYRDDVSKHFDYWRFLRIDEQSFSEEAEIGDLILCQSKKKLVLGQNKEANKVAMVVKIHSDVNATDKSELYVLRVGTDPNQPIILQSWQDFRLFRSQNYSDCWFRHLYCERNDDFLIKSQYFIKRITENPHINKEVLPNKFRSQKTDDTNITRGSELPPATPSP